ALALLHPHCPVVATAPAQAALALCGRQSPCQRVATLATGGAALLVVGLAAAGRPYWLAVAGRARGWPPLTGYCPCGRSPLCRGALAVTGRPLQVARPGPVAPWRSYIHVFQIRIEKMKEVKRPPLERYPHDGSLQRNSSNLI
ncbi:hypothetical protein BHE74_00029955, partial [Ensete ventricosum]